MKSITRWLLCHFRNGSSAFAWRSTFLSCRHFPPLIWVVWSSFLSCQLFFFTLFPLPRLRYYTWSHNAMVKPAIVDLGVSPLPVNRLLQQTWCHILSAPSQAMPNSASPSIIVPSPVMLPVVDLEPRVKGADFFKILHH